jgi:hypothetical protein
MRDNFESRMNLIIEQRARFRADMELLKEQQAETRRLIEAEREKVHQLADVIIPLTRHTAETDRRREVGARTDELLRQRAEAGARTDRRLAALINTVDKLVRGNGS